MADHNDLGFRGEDLATAHLLSKGFSILERNWKSGHKEIDVIATTRTEIVFVEVKTRHSEDCIAALDAVDRKKRQLLIYAADAYVRQHQIDLPARFDIITIVGTAPDFHIEHIEDAFIPTLAPLRKRRKL